MAIHTLLPLMGPAAGPITCGHITQETIWRWVYWVSSITGSICEVADILFLSETYGPRRIRNKVSCLKTKTDLRLRAEFEDLQETLSRSLSVNLIWPFRLLGAQSNIQFLALYMAWRCLPVRKLRVGKWLVEIVGSQGQTAPTASSEY